MDMDELNEKVFKDGAPRKTERFHQIPIFSNLNGKEVGRILRITDEVVIKTGEFVFQPGEAPDGFYILLDGRVDIRIPPGGPNQRETSIATLSNRSVFGEMSFIGKRNRSAFAVALEETRLNKINGADFYDMLDKGDVAAYKVIYNCARLIGTRLRRVENELLQVLSQLGPDTRKQKLAELQEFRDTLFQEWSF